MPGSFQLTRTVIPMGKHCVHHFLVATSLAVATLVASAPASAADPPAVTDLAEELQQCVGMLRAAAKANPGHDAGEQAEEWTSGDFFYPPLANLAGEQGSVAISLLVDGLGNPRYPHALAMSASGGDQQFLKAALEDIRRTHFDPGTEAGLPASRWGLMRLSYQQPKGMYIKIHFWNDDYLASIRKAAEAGDVNGMAAVSYVDFLGAPLLHESPKDDDVRWRYLAYAALGGDPVSLLRVHETLKRAKCSRGAEFDAAFSRLAEHGNPWVAVSLAQRLMQVNPQANAPRALGLLRVAAQSTVASARALAIGVMATSGNQALRDPVFALAQARATSVRNDTDTLEAYAAALAANDDFREAVQAEQSALDLANRANWRTAQMEKRLQRYRAGAAAEGPVCDCTLFAP
jgi:hypothetical protein